ncbi:MAG: serine hydrolase [bacterium]
MRTNIYIILLMAFVFLFRDNFAQSNDGNLTSKIESVLNKAVDLDIFSGQVLVAKKNEIIFNKAYGEANKDFHIKNTLETKFNIASITKTFTATAIMMLSQRGLLVISDPVIKYLPDFPFGDKITIYQLLTHSSGLGDYEDNPEYISQMFNIRKISDILKIIYKEKLEFNTPGQEMVYSNSGVVVLGALIEKISKITYAEFLRKNIFEPLKMKNTFYIHSTEIVENRAVGYIKKPLGDFIITTYKVNPPSSATGILTTAFDLFLFDQALYGNKLIDEKHKNLMFTQSYFPKAKIWGCLWQIYNRNNYPLSVGLSGRQFGFTSVFMRYIEEKYTIIVLSNYDAGARIFNQIESVLLSKEYAMPQMPLEEFIYSVSKKGRFEETYRNIEIILEQNNYKIITERILNEAAYVLINDDELEMAINFLRINNKLFRNSANTYDSLGEAYMLVGNVKLAVENYEKSLQLDPNNENAVERLKILKNN